MQISPPLPPGRVTMVLRPSLLASGAFALVLGMAIGFVAPRAQDAGERTFTVAARQYAFSPAVIEVNQDDLVRITFTTTDIPHSFTVDKYRIAKRVELGKSVVFEFRADQPGRFPIYCNLTIDERCKNMRGELVVKSRN